jgi:AsmA protein
MNPPRDDLRSDRGRSRYIWRWLAGGALVILLGPAIVITVMIARFDPSRYAPAVIQAVDRATGRHLTLGGPITVQLSLTPTVVLQDISLANPPGFSHPNLLTLRRVEAKISLIPLFSHKVNILAVALIGPEIFLESGKSGAADWDLSQPQRAEAAEPSAPRLEDVAGYTLAVQAVDIRDGTVNIGTSGNKYAAVISVPQLTGTASSLSAPLHFTGNAALRSRPFSVSGVVGPLERFSGVGSGPWPVDLTMNMGGAKVTIRGTVAHPRTAQGYDLVVHVNIPALKTISQNFSLPDGQILPAFQNVVASARIVDQNSTIPAIDDLSIKLGQADLTSFWTGLTLDQADIEMASLDQPLSLKLTGTLDSNSLIIDGKFGAPQALFDPTLLPASMPPQGSFPVEATIQIGAASGSVDGAIATPAKRAGVALAVKASIPDLSALSSATGQRLPAWKNILLQTTLIDPGGLGLSRAVGLDGLTFSMDDAAFGGDASVYFGAQPRLQLAVKISQINVDALEASLPPPVTTPADKTHATASAGNVRTLPDIRLPMETLRTANADIQISADTLIWNDATYAALQAHAVLANAVLTLDPATGELPGGSVTLNGLINARQDPATESFAFSAPALALSPLLKGFGLPSTAEGTAQAQITARSSGDDLATMAAGVNGQLGVAAVDGTIDGSVLDSLFGAALRSVGLPDSTIGAQDPVTMRCAALRLDAVNGIGTVRTLVVDSSRLLLQGKGHVNFGNQTLNLVLQPQLRMAGNEIGVPVQITGSFEAPHSRLASEDALATASQDAAGLSVSLAQRLFGKSIVQAAATSGILVKTDVCPAALTLARLGQPGPPAPPMPTLPAPGSTPAIGGPKNLLNALLGK